MAAPCQANDENTKDIDNDFVMESFFAFFGSHMEEKPAAPTPLPGDETIGLEELPWATRSVDVSAAEQRVGASTEVSTQCDPLVN
jgi:hypothetical protein